MKSVFSKILPSVGALAVLMAAPSYAQEVAGETTEDSGDEIVVTGTSIRGVAPAGAETVTLDQEAITATSSSNTAEVLASIPQLGDFNSLPSVIALGAQQTTNRPAVRGLSSGTSGGSPTLILMDGHRLVGAGVVQTVPDPDVVPPGALARVEVATDGGSSVYGSDAVGGVINLITRRDYDGLEVNLRQGFGDEYQSTDAYFTAGQKWATGSAYLSYNYSQHDAIFGRDRDYVRNITYDPTSPLFGLPTGRSCAQGNLTLNPDSSGNGAEYLVVNGAPAANPATAAEVRCDLTDDYTTYPQERRDSLFFGWNQDLTDALSFDLRAWYTVRTSKLDVGANLSPTSDNFRDIRANNNNFFDSITGAPNEVQRVFFDFSGVPGLDTTARVELETYGFAPQFTLDLGHDWQARAFLNYGHSVTSSNNPKIDGAAIQANFANINFYDLGATSPAILEQLFVRDTGRGEGELVNGRLVFDGPALRLPAGELRVATGIEYLGERFNNYNTQTNPLTAEDSRRSHAVFLEASIPVVSPDNNIPLVHELNVNLSARNDTYSDFGSVTTPRYGITYAPIDWVRLRGNWGKSFQAPSLADTAGAGTSTLSSFSTNQLAAFVPFTNNVDNQHLILATFGATDLDAQRAETFSLGADISPPFIRNLDLGVTYWHIDYAGQVASPPVIITAFWDDDATWGDVRVSDDGENLNPSVINAFLLTTGLSQQQIDEREAQLPQGFDNVNVIVDFRRRNLASVRLAGWDGYLRYTHDTDFGSIFFNLNSTFRATSKFNGSGLGFAANTADNGTSPRWSASSTLGANVGPDFRAQATIQFTPSYDITPTLANNGQGRIESFHPIDLYAQYDGFGEDMSLSLGLNNAFDDPPPSLNGVSQTTFGHVGGTLGRVLFLGINKRF